MLPTAGLTKYQIAFVASVLIFTLIGAVIVAMAIRRWNAHSRSPAVAGRDG